MNVQSESETNARRLLWAGFVAILAAGMGFGIRGGIFDNWGAEFGFTATQLGAIGGAGFSGFCFGIIIGGLVCDRIGYGKLVPRNIIAKYLGPEQFEQLDKQKESRLRSSVRAVKRLIRLGDDSIVVRGIDDLMVTRARCCNPLHGEEIIGYVTRGKGVAVHTTRCKNVTQLMVNRERIVEVEWAGRPENHAAARAALVAAHYSEYAAER